MKKKFKYLFYVILIFLSFFAFTWFSKVNAATIDNYIVTAIGYSTTQGYYKTLYDDSGPTGEFVYGSNSFIYFNNIQMGVPEKNSGDKYSYILGVQVCQTSDIIKLNYDAPSVHNQVNYIDSLGGYKTNSTCTVNVYTGKKVNYYFEVNGTLTSNGDTAFTDQRFVLLFDPSYTEFYITNISFDEYSQELVNQIQSSIKQNELITNQDITNSKLDGVQSEIGETNDKLDTQIEQEKEAETTRKGMWETLKSMLNYINPLSKDFFAYKLVELILNMLKSLFIPENMDFVTDFVDALESKLGFIASVPVAIIEFIMDLANATWTEFKSIQLPSISIFGYNFWNAQEIDLTEAINIFKPFKYVTDVICVVICAQTLNKWREKFTGGGSGK